MVTNKAVNRPLDPLAEESRVGPKVDGDGRSERRSDRRSDVLVDDGGQCCSLPSVSAGRGPAALC